MKKSKGKVRSVNESLVGTGEIEGAVMNGEVAYITIEDGKRLKARSHRRQARWHHLPSGFRRYQFG